MSTPPLLLVLPIVFLLHILLPQQCHAATKNQPNLIIVMTDEHNYRTLGCYRNQLQHDQAFLWGNGIQVDTPHLDSLAQQGALLTHFFTTSPMCTPSRASFVSGLYPPATGAAENHSPMHNDTVTFAQILMEQGWDTGFVGKWHLNGEDLPGWANDKEPVFGFNSTKYMYNRGNFKFFNEEDGIVKGYHWNSDNKKKFSKTMETNYVTDWIVDRGIDFIEEKRKSNAPFALMLSIPDPHDPYDVRPPYDTMYDDLFFDLPDTAVAALGKEPASPNWAPPYNLKKFMGIKRWKKINVRLAEKRAKILRENQIRQSKLRLIFGMVKCLDDNMGKLLAYLKESALEEDTIVVFTSDHGDSMGEHLRHNKLTPYDTSAGTSFIMRYPGKITAGKVIRTAYSSIDFAPTILNLMGVEHNLSFPGKVATQELLSPTLDTNNEDQMVFMTSRAMKKEMIWAGALTSKYKLILSVNDVPWLFDRINDPSELINYHNDTNYSDAIDLMQENLLTEMIKHNFPIADNAFLLETPDCRDSPDVFLKGKKQKRSDCLMIKSDKRKAKWCQNQTISTTCSVKCDQCFQDSIGMMWIDRNLGAKDCSFVKDNIEYCDSSSVNAFCLESCEG